MIRSRVRMLGSILVKLKEYNKHCFKSRRIDQKCNTVNVSTFADILDPRMNDNLIIAIQSIVGADAESNECKSPSTATTAGTWVSKIAKLYEKELIKQRKYKKAKDVEYFLKIDEVFPIKVDSFDGTHYRYLHACELMRRFSKLCDAQHPERLRATELRKHFATTVAPLKIDECQIYDISNSMGHAENIHRSYYRQSVVTRDLCGVSKILEVASGVPNVIPRAQTNAGSMLNQSEDEQIAFRIPFYE
ncbi:hypothetical protein KQX54_016723 [Cotesia glomerata]|uniref:Uncharacterized protein n=1 Tax=Cotesia glomerata TaxID=32391 RepID=A0AAV7IQV8_COTGL|nr:hypothetical protein KQX54_016723 [Cotesia glomerata]